MELEAHRPSERHPSPTNWADEVLYMLLPDRFSNGQETEGTRLKNRSVPLLTDPGRQAWAESGAFRFQGGTLRGVASKLDYLAGLGVTAIWLGPPWKQRLWSDDYHGYAIQHYYDVDPRFGTRGDLVDLVASAHRRQIRVILDVIVNHTAENWRYAPTGQDGPSYEPVAPSAGLSDYDIARFPTYKVFPFGAWYARDGSLFPAGAMPPSSDDGVWSSGPLQDPAAYHRAGFGDYGHGDPAQSAFVENRVADYYNRDLALTDGPLGGSVLEAMIDVWSYWLELTDCDGFRIDTFKHIRVEEGRTFCGAIRERAESLGKDNFLLVAEVAGGDRLAEDYLDADGVNLSAVLEIWELKTALRGVAGGKRPAIDFFGLAQGSNSEPTTTSETLPSARWPVSQWLPASHRDLGNALVFCLDDHDNVVTEKERFATVSPGLTVPALALLTLTLGIPCIYYGTEQELALDEALTIERLLDPRTNRADRFLREAMFGPDHPRRSGLEGLPTSGDPFDPGLPGFGPFGTSGEHVFDTAYPAYLQTAAMLKVRRQEVALRRGRQYLREVRPVGQGDFGFPAAGGVVAWSRVLAGREVVCAANLSTSEVRSVDVTVDSSLTTGASMTVLLDTTDLTPASVATAPVQQPDPAGRRWVTVSNLAPAAVWILG